MDNPGGLTSSDVHDREAYFPREPGPEVERHWPASVRAMAIAWAREARLPSVTGLAVDDATLADVGRAGRRRPAAAPRPPVARTAIPALVPDAGELSSA